jgi:CRISPR-associated protein Csm4
MPSADTVVAYDLTPRGAMRFGERGAGVETAQDTMHADTMFSALCFGVLESAGTGRLEEMLRAFDKAPPFLISSLLPRVGEVRFLPRPPMARRAAPPSDEPAASGARKAFKRLRYVSWGLFGALASNPGLLADDGAAVTGPGGDAWYLPAEREALGEASDASSWWKQARRPRVTLDRQTGKSTLYFVKASHYAPGVGLTLLVRWLDPAWRSTIECALDVLADTGIGGERSAGYGQFTCARGVAVTLPGPDSSPHFITLAPYCPTTVELDDDLLGAGASWDLVTRGGWVGASGSGSRRHSPVKMLALGSILRFPANSGRVALGQLLVVTPAKASMAFRVRRYGFAFPVPVAATPEAS